MRNIRTNWKKRNQWSWSPIVFTETCGFWIKVQIEVENHLVRGGQSEDKYGRGEDGDEVDKEKRVRLEQLVTTSQTVVLRLAPWMMIISV